MNNEALNEFLKFMTETLRQSKEFTLTQAPEVMKEIIRYSIFKSVAGIILGLFLIFLAYKIYVFLVKKIREDKYGSGEFELGYIPVALLAVVGLAVIFDNAYEGIKASLAPRVYLIEYFAHLVGKK